MAYIVKPFDTMTGAHAPGIVSFCEKTDDAIADVKSRSKLSTFPRWSFRDCRHLKDKIPPNSRYQPQD